MRYLYEGGKPRRKMHVARYTKGGTMLFAARCGIEHRFNRSINAPFSLGRGVCKNCQRKIKKQ